MIGLWIQIVGYWSKYSELDPGNGLRELFALNLGDFELKRGGGTRAIGAGEGTGTPRGSTVNLFQVAQLGEDVLVPERGEDDTVVGQSGERSVCGHLLPSTRSTSRNEETGVFALESTLSPETTGMVPESLPLSGEGTVTGGDTKEEGVVVDEVSRFEDFVVGLGRGMEQLQDIFGKGFLDLEDFCSCTSGFDTRLDAFSELGNMAVHGVDDDYNPWVRHWVCSE